MGEEENRKQQRIEAQAAGNVYSRKGFYLSAAVLVLVTGALVAGRPYIEALVAEASVSLGHLGGDGAAADLGGRGAAAAAIIRRQREAAAEAHTLLAEMDELLLKAQKEEGVEDLDADFITEFAPPAVPKGYVKADDYDYDDDDAWNGEVEQEEEEEEEASRPPAEAAERARPPPRRAAVPAPVAPRPGAGELAAPAAAEIGSAAAKEAPPSTAGTRHAGFSLRRRRHGGAPLTQADREPEPVVPPQPRQRSQAPVEAGGDPGGRRGGGAVQAAAAAADEEKVKADEEEEEEEGNGGKEAGEERAGGRVANTRARRPSRSTNSPTPREELTRGLTVVPMKGNAYDLEFVEKHGKQLGYETEEGHVKVWEHPKWPLRKDRKWMQPQHICPGAQKMRSLKDGEPKKSAYVKRAIELMAEGMLQVNNTHVIENRCMYLNKDCADLSLEYGGNKAMKMLKMKPEAYEAWRSNRLVDLKPRMFGSCALVANGDNLLKGKRGADIDAHDTIFRHNTPVKGFEKFVGERKSSIIWVKAKYLRQLKANKVEAEFMYDLLLGVDRLPKSYSFQGKPLLIVNKEGGYNLMLRERMKWYDMAGAKSKNHPSGGFSRPLTLLASGLCTRVDIYGFSSRPSGKYFQRSFKVLPTHMMRFEHWVYRYLQSKGRLCVYGE